MNILGITYSYQPMVNSLKALAQHLKEVTESGKISKAELSRLAKIDAPSLHHYIKEETCPKLDVLDRLAEALKCDPRELIKPENEPIQKRPHELQDCFEAIGKTIKVPIRIIPSGDQYILAPDPSGDPRLKDIISIFPSLDEPQKVAIYDQMIGLARMKPKEESG